METRRCKHTCYYNTQVKANFLISVRYILYEHAFMSVVRPEKKQCQMSFCSNLYADWCNEVLWNLIALSSTSRRCLKRDRQLCHCLVPVLQSFVRWQGKKDRLRWHSIYHLDVVKLKDTVPNAKNWGLIYLLNGPYVTSVVAAWVRRSAIHQSTTHSFLEKYGKLLTGSIRKCGEWNQFMLCALHLGITCIDWFLLVACCNLLFKLSIKQGEG